MGVGKGKAEERWDCISNMAYFISLAMGARRRVQARLLFEVSNCCSCREWYIISMNSEMFRLLNIRERLTSVKWLMVPSYTISALYNSCWGRNNSPTYKMYINSKRRKETAKSVRCTYKLKDTKWATCLLPCFLPRSAYLGTVNVKDNPCHTKGSNITHVSVTPE